MARKDHLNDVTNPRDPWYARWWQRGRRSKYQPHQSTREKARRVRQRLKRDAA